MNSADDPDEYIHIKIRNPSPMDECEKLKEQANLLGVHNTLVRIESLASRMDSQIVDRFNDEALEPNKKQKKKPDNLMKNFVTQDKSNSLPNCSKNLLRNKHLDKARLIEIRRDAQAMHPSNFPELEPSTIEEDYNNIRKIINDLQKISSTIAKKYEVDGDDSLDLVTINGNAPDIARDLQDTRNLSETENLLEKETLTNIQWNDGKSPTTPGDSSSPDSLFLGSKNRFRKKNTKYPQRAVLKNGECNVLQKNRLGHSRLRYLQDIFTTLVDIKWRWTLLIFSLSFIGSWLFYAGIYWLIAYAHGDFQHLDDENWTRCVENLNGFTSAFLFSVETQHTIGYGGRSTNEECPEAIFIMCIQSVTGVMISAFMAGIFFAKMARPKHRTQTLLFSRRALICQRDGQLCLMFRVGDMRKSHIIGTSIRAHIFRTRTTREGEVLQQYQGELSVAADACESGLLFLWPLTIVHVIDKNSPLYSISAQELLHEKFEIVAVLEGTVESTGQTTQARSSYIPSEIKWGHRFESILSYNEDRQGFEIDYKKFNNTIKVATPLCSARDLEELYLIHSELLESNTNNHTPESVA